MARSVAGPVIKIKTSGGWYDSSSGSGPPPDPDDPPPDIAPSAGSPSPPRNLVATAFPASVSLEWDDPATIGTGTELASHNVEMATAYMGPYVLVSTVTAATHQRTVVPINPGTPYYFRVRSANMALPEAFSLQSNVVSATPLAAPTTPDTWDEAVATGDLVAITLWYQANTGYLSDGFNPNDVWGPGQSADLTIDDAWVEANEGPNVVNDAGVWTITGLTAAAFDIAMNDVVLSHCFADRPYSLDANGFNCEGDYVGIVIDHCTAKGNYGTGNHNDFGDGIGYYNPADHTAGNFIVQYCDISGYRAGNLMYFGTTSEYNWVHDLYIFSDSHNTANSIRGENCTVYRNLLTDGTSSAISLYADSNPFTRFYIVENVLTVEGNALQEVNFPMRPPDNWHQLVNGYDRQMVGNYFVDGTSGDNAYFTRTFDNKLLDGTHIFFDNGETATPHEPYCIKYRYNELGGGPLPNVDTYEFTPTPNSTLLVLVGAQNGGHQTTQNPVVTATGQFVSGQTFSKIAESALDPASGDNYAMKLWLYKATVGATVSFEHINVDPYPSSSAVSYFTFWVFEVPSTTGLTLVRYSEHMEHSLSFGGTLGTITSSPLSQAATNGNLVVAFGAGSAQADNEWGDVSGWAKMGTQEKVAAAGVPCVIGAAYWRKNFTGTQIAIPSTGVQLGGILLCEFSGA